MVRYKIPEQYLPGFKLIFNLTNKKVQLIQRTLLETPIGYGPERAAKSVEKELDLKGEEIEIIFKTIYSLINLKMEEEDETDNVQFLNDIVEAYQRVDEELLDKKKSKLLNNLLALIESDNNIKNTIKATELLYEHERTFIEGRIITDVRLVFDEDVEKADQSALIIHKLKIKYLKDGKYEEVYYTLDFEDLTKLKNIAERGIKKDRLIRNNTIENISFIDIDID